MDKEQKNIATPQDEHDSALEAFAVNATKYIGSTTSLLLHSFFFIGIFSLQWFGFSFERIMLILTTVVSLEAIYLSIFIQLTINRQSRQIEEVSEDVEEIQEDVEEISKDLDEIQEDVEEIQEDTKEINADVEGIQEHIESIEENVEDLSEELEKDDATDAAERNADMQKINKIENVLEELLQEVKKLKK
ncbi:MAG: hypothetical protein A2494_01540 [Candidatus Lloydbacteria bacterium RIFOXYC12_FULL_46_25]|uniref:Uncharacterized protein n=1 Tax=Candidatus Lloydbacteria bacterium RIFOXYC12_FULL_46_25 TaxID=1798670 RepID=A0A1G2E074_9BACT|nr:MAG: hypothetical protein A2494_01540 [Candidatus Lloydbacteria bacterium RIFOXYC12_FULL_46_25]